MGLCGGDELCRGPESVGHEGRGCSMWECRVGLTHTPPTAAETALTEPLVGPFNSIASMPQCKQF